MTSATPAVLQARPREETEAYKRRHNATHEHKALPDPSASAASDEAYHFMKSDTREGAFLGVTPGGRPFSSAFKPAQDRPPCLAPGRGCRWGLEAADSSSRASASQAGRRRPPDSAAARARVSPAIRLAPRPLHAIPCQDVSARVYPSHGRRLLTLPRCAIVCQDTCPSKLAVRGNEGGCRQWTASCGRSRASSG